MFFSLNKVKSSDKIISEASRVFFSLNKVKSSGKIMLYSVTKTTNMYKMLKKKFGKFMNKNVTKRCEKPTTSTELTLERQNGIAHSLTSTRYIERS